MRWIQIGERAHAVVRNNRGSTLCGLELTRTDAIIVSPPFEDRCGSCDNVWRRRGRATRKRVNKPPMRDVYRPRYTFEDYDL